ncbi:fimbria/pilus outer membrane usher protein, partial [Serratia marcescens]|uniref:fimbria/pilus outer membrane usher protein n=1 Tax=Serratia marcescens TaxID=615 RepID=UPI001EF7FB8B
MVPYLAPYQESTIQLRTDTLPDDVELESNSHKVVPTRGAIVRARFSTAVGKRLMMTLTNSQGKPIPFGAVVSQNAISSIVGD